MIQNNHITKNVNTKIVMEYWSDGVLEYCK